MKAFWTSFSPLHSQFEHRVCFCATHLGGRVFRKRLCFDLVQRDEIRPLAWVHGTNSMNCLNWDIFSECIPSLFATVLLKSSFLVI